MPNALKFRWRHAGQQEGRYTWVPWPEAHGNSCCAGAIKAQSQYGLLLVCSILSGCLVLIWFWYVLIGFWYMFLYVSIYFFVLSKFGCPCPLELIPWWSLSQQFRSKFWPPQKNIKERSAYPHIKQKQMCAPCSAVRKVPDIVSTLLHSRGSPFRRNFGRSCAASGRLRKCLKVSSWRNAPGVQCQFMWSANMMMFNFLTVGDHGCKSEKPSPLCILIKFFSLLNPWVA